jgi:hypothetical protein
MVGGGEVGWPENQRPASQGRRAAHGLWTNNKLTHFRTRARRYYPIDISVH